MRPNTKGFSNKFNGSEPSCKYLYPLYLYIDPDQKIIVFLQIALKWLIIARKRIIKNDNSLDVFKTQNTKHKNATINYFTQATKVIWRTKTIGAVIKKQMPISPVENAKPPESLLFKT